ncbi:MAG: DUF1273 family protein [Clostridia bacterium]|nr:DUF1273 family protein [Clostridia bacterium]
MKKELSCCFTGHRVLGKDFSVQALEDAIEYMIGKGVKYFISGAAIGFDTYAADAVLKAKEKHKDIELHLYIPCSNQNEKWTAQQRIKHAMLLKACDYADIEKREYFDGCMKIRNYKMVDNSSYCIAYFHENEKRASGTGQTFRYAKKCGYEIINIAN